MSILHAIILGFVQGATEFAPISSSGHLILVPWAFGWDTLGTDLEKTFDVALHLGTLIGALAYFRKDVVRYAKAFGHSVASRSIRGTDQRIAWALVLGTIPGALLGAAFEGPIQEHLGAPWLIAFVLAAFGILLWWVDARRPQERGFDSIAPRTGLGLGIAQAIALQPGVSRSGVTITAGRWIGLDREAAARFSFLLMMPIIAGAGLYKGIGLTETGLQGYGSVFLWGMASSAVGGFVVVWGLLKYLRRHGFAVFMWYRLAIAAIVLLLIVTGARPATIGG
jgi:undecaprenyl-diphosphatase